MKIILSLFIISAIPIMAISEINLNQAQNMMKSKQIDKATIIIEQLQKIKPYDPWLTYNSGVTAYANKNFDKAEEVWQDLATKKIPTELRDKIWMQIGNVSFRKGEPHESNDPQTTANLWEQSREAYRIAISSDPRNKTLKHNLNTVEHRLAEIHSKLAKQLIEQAKSDINIDKKIKRMEAALDHQLTAHNLVKENKQYKEDLDKTQKELAELYNKIAKNNEEKADNSENKEEKIENLQKSLSDYKTAESFDPQNKESQDGDKRVSKKLAETLYEEGKETQKMASEKENNGDKQGAINDYEKSIDKYNQVLEIDNNHIMAQSGINEVESALERLHEQNGDAMADSGFKNAEQGNIEKAANKLENALSEYSDASSINPNNLSIPPKMDKIENALPELLNQLGSKEQNMAEQEKSLEKAISHMEKALTSFQKSLNAKGENNPIASIGEQQTMNKLSQMRQQLAQNNQKNNNQNKNKNPSENDAESLYAMISKAKNERKQEEYDSILSGTAIYQEDNEKIFKTW